MSTICDAHKKRALNYYTTQCTGNSISLEIRPVGEKMLDWGTCPREAGPPGPRLSSPGERERNAVMANRVGVNMLQFCSVSNSLLHTTLSIKWGLNEYNLRRPQEEGVELLYNSVHRKFNQFGDQTSWREDAGLRNMSQRGWAPRPPVEQPRRTRKKRGYGQ